MPVHAPSGVIDATTPSGASMMTPAGTGGGLHVSTDWHADVMDAAVFGVPTPDGVDEICAAVAPGPNFDPDAILRYCRKKLADKAPSRIVVVAEIPRTDMGKIKRSELRDGVVAGRIRA